MSIFSPEHLMARDMIRRWCQAELAPRVHALESGEELPYDLIRKLAQTFDFASRSDEIVEQAKRSADNSEHGVSDSAHASQHGVDHDGCASEHGVSDGAESADETRRRRRQARLEQSILMSIISWELCRVNPGFCFAFGASIGLAGQAILAKGTPEQKIKYAAPIYAFDKIGAWALTEPDAGSDALGSMKTRATRDGDHFVISGQKRFITNAPYADIFVVYAHMIAENGRETVGAFLLERGEKGLETSTPMKKMGLRSSPTGDVFLDQVRVPANRLLGGERQSRKGEVVKRLAAERAAMVPMCLGILERCIEISVDYAQSRVQFGKPIANFQLVQAKLARMQVAYENSLGLFDRILRQMEADALDLKLACAAKLYVSEEATRVALDAVQILGGNGYTEEYQVEMFARDAKLFEIGGGTSEIQLLTIAKEMLRG